MKPHVAVSERLLIYVVYEVNSWPQCCIYTHTCVHVVVQSFSPVQLFKTPRTAAHWASLSFTVSRSLLTLTSIELAMPPNHLILCRPRLLPPSVFPSIRVFSNQSALHIRWPEYWSFSFSISPSNEHPGLISLRMDSLDLLAVQGALRTLLQHHGSKASLLRPSAFFTVQLSHPYMPTGKTIALTRQTFVSKVMSLPFSTLSRWVITFLPRSKHLLISWLQSQSTVILEPKTVKSATASTYTHVHIYVSIPNSVFGIFCCSLLFWLCHEAWGLGPLHWKHRVLSNGPPGNSCISISV